MQTINLYDKKTLNELFCKAVGIKQVSCYIKNLLTGEIRFYQERSSQYKVPKGWNKDHIERVNFPVPTYPDLFKAKNFIKLLNTHWFIFDSLGSQYKKIDNEDFETNYIFTRLMAVQMCKTLGGGELLGIYIKEVQNLEFDYLC